MENNDPGVDDARFWGVAGSGKSRRFMTRRSYCRYKFSETSDLGSELARIGSYTRACRCVLDTNAAAANGNTG